ncbi:MAG TPA: LptA/OstA family protein, partial [Thermoanaerobaculia bacterium]
TRGAFVLEARSGRYDVPTREATLEGPVRGSGTGEGSGGVTSLAADSAIYRRDQFLVELAGGVRVERGETDWLEADRVLLKSSPEAGRLEWARATGSARGRTGGSPPSPGRPAVAARAWSAADAAVTFDASGEARRLDLGGSPATLEEPQRRLRASTIQIDLAAGAPVAVRANGKVRIDAGRDVVTADSASVSFGPDGSVQASEAAGGVKMEGEGRKASADRVVEIPERSAILLTGEGGRLATVSQEGSALSAPRVEIDRTRRTIAGRGGAQARLLPRPGSSSASGGILGDPKRPVHGKGDAIVLDENSRVAILSGHASLWQDESSVSAENITVNDTERTLVAVGAARAVLPVSSESTPPAGRPRSPAVRSVATAPRLSWSEAKSEARLEEGVTVERGTQRASARTATAHLGADRRLDRVDMEGDVRLSDSATGRSARAEKATDFPKEGKTVLEGNPAVAEDAEGNKVAGATLTITGRGRSVEVTAPSGGTTETVHKTRPD